MATLTIRDLDESLKRRLRTRAASRNRSMEEEARQILRAALADASGPTVDIVSRIRSRFSGLGDFELAVPEREPVRAPPDLRSSVKPARSAQPAKGRVDTVVAKRPASRRRK